MTEKRLKDAIDINNELKTHPAHLEIIKLWADQVLDDTYTIYDETNLQIDRR